MMVLDMPTYDVRLVVDKTCLYLELNSLEYLILMKDLTKIWLRLFLFIKLSMKMA